MEIRAKLMNAKMGTRKGRQVADLVRDKPCAEALAILQGCQRSPARPIEKLIRSALANAEEKNSRDKAGIDVDNLIVGKITVDQGPSMWRIRPRAQGRASWIQKKSSHVEVVLSEQ